LNKLRSGNRLVLNGNFVILRTIYLPSNFAWVLNGKISLGNNASTDSVGINENGIDSRRRTAITEQPGGATNIDMSGGVYYGNKQNNATNRVRLINFIKVTNSKFHDMTIESASDDNFTLGVRSNHNECRRLVSRDAGLEEGDKSGNGLTDKGEYNKWFDSIAENCTSDGWTPKSRYSEFTRCVGRGNKGPGFGLYARRDGSPENNNQGESIVGNKFYACEAYSNKRAGFSANVSSNCGNGAVIKDNFVQGAFYNNGMEGVLFRNKLANGVVSNNKVDILVFGNQGLMSNGSPASTGAGLGIDGAPVSGITGAVVGYHNSYGHSKNDIHLGAATGCSITVYDPQGKTSAVVQKGSSTNSVSTKTFSCPSSLSVWSAEAYCGGKHK
jgi:hypothetical protein